MGNRHSAPDATPFFPDDDPTNPVQTNLAQPVYHLEVSAPGYTGPTYFPLPQTGLKGRALEVGRSPDKGLAINLPGLGRVHFFLIISNGIVQARSYNSNPLSVNGRAVPTDGWLDLAPGQTLDCGSNIGLRLVSNRAALDGMTPFFDQPSADFRGQVTPPAPLKGSIKAAPEAATPAAPFPDVTPDMPLPEEILAPPRQPRPVERRFRLWVKDSRYELKGEVFFSLRDGEMVEIGRYPSSLGAIRLMIDDPKVSQRHAYLLVKGTDILLFDGDPDTRKPSHNGTWFQLNGRLTKISGSQGLKINAGSSFRVGYTNLVLENFAG